LFNVVERVVKRYLLEDILVIQDVMNVNIKEIEKLIHNLTVKKWRLLHKDDEKWLESERKRKRESYSMHSINRIKAQHKWNQANRIKTRIYNRRCYVKRKAIKVLSIR